LGTWAITSASEATASASLATSTAVSSSSASASITTSATSSSASASVAFSWASHLALFRQELLVLDEWRWDEFGLGPEIWGQVGVGLLKALEHGSGEVLSGSGLTSTSGVDVINTGEGEDLLGDQSGNSTGTSWCWDHSNCA